MTAADHRCFIPMFLTPGDFHQCGCGQWWKINAPAQRRPAWWARIMLHLNLARQIVRWRNEADR